MNLDGNPRTIGSVVRPQKVIIVSDHKENGLQLRVVLKYLLSSADKSVVQSVVDFISDALPQGSVPHKTNDKEVVIWIKIDQSERLGYVSDPQSPVYLTVGYTHGVQVWAIEPHGEAWEVYSSRQGPVKSLRLLPLPEVFGSGDAFAAHRPLICVTDSSPVNGVSFISLLSGEKVHNIRFRSAIENIYCNKRVLVITFSDRFLVYDACSLKERVSIHASFPVHLVSPNPITLGHRWIAYGESKLHEVYHSRGGKSCGGTPSYTASVLNAAKSISQGISNLGEVVAGSISGSKKIVATNFATATLEEKREGIVTVIDLETVGDGEVNLGKTGGAQNRTCVVAHFLAHSSSAIAALAFNADGQLVLTVSQAGQNFHIFRIFPHPAGSAMTLVQHLYTLHRGDTNATVQDITFSLDSRWVAVTSMRATTHIFPVTPYGGPITFRTHSSCRVVNKVSRFMKSAGLDELDLISVNSHPVIVIQALAQIKHSGTVKSNQPTPGSSKAQSTVENIRVATCFSPRRSKTQHESNACDGLLIATSHGVLGEYSLQPFVISDVKRISEDSEFGLNVHPQAQWILNRHLSHIEFLPPFSDSHPLRCSTAFSTQTQKLCDSDSVFPAYGSLGHRIVNTGVDSEPWLSQVEIVTHAGPARRLWMGPQFHFAPISTPNCQSSFNYGGISHGTEYHITRTGSDWDLTNLKLTNIRIRSAPVSMPVQNQTGQYPMTIEAGSGSFDTTSYPDTLPRESNSSYDLSEIADAMTDFTGGRDHVDGCLLKKGNEGDESPEDLSATIMTESINSGKSNQPSYGIISDSTLQPLTSSSELLTVIHSRGPNSS